MSGTCSGSKAIHEDEEEDVVYKPPVVPPMTPLEDAVVPNTSSDSPSQQSNPDVDATPFTPAEREFMNRDTFAATQTFMELLFPKSIVNEYVASPSDGARSSEADHSANDG